MINHKSALADITDIFVSPTNFFDTLRKNPSASLPFLCVILTSALIVIWYYQAVDYQWFIEDTVSVASNDNLTKSELNNMREGLSTISPTAQGAISAFVIALWIAGSYILLSLYFTIVSAVSNDGFRFGDWISLVSWCYMPTLLSYLAVGVNILLMENGQLRLEQLDPMTLNNLWLKLSDSSSFKSIFNSLSLTFAWSLVLMITGYRRWTKRSVVVSAATVLFPFVVIYGVWALMAVY